MRRFLGILLLVPALALLSSTTQPAAHAAAPYDDPLSGSYISGVSGRTCHIYAQPMGGYLFVDEAGAQAAFSVVRPRQLGITATLTWNPDVVATVIPDRFGRIAKIRFDLPGSDPIFWVR